MQDQHSANHQEIVTAGFGGSDLRSLSLCMADGTSVSLRRFLHRWLVLLVTDNPDVTNAPPRFRDGAYQVAVLLGTPPAQPVVDLASPVLYDRGGQLAAMFPGLTWPATFLLDPEGRLIAIVAGNDCAGLIRHVLFGYGVPEPSSGGAIDLGDISG